MQFTTIRFLLFAAVVLLGYFLLPQKARWVFLLIANLFFYLCAGLQYSGFLLLTALTTYGAGLCMGHQLDKQDHYLAENKATLSREEKKEYKA